MTDPPPLPPLPPDVEADLAELADGRLDPRREAELRARVTEDPDLARALDDQQRGRDLIRAASAPVPAPAALRSRLEALERDAAAIAAPAPARPPRTRSWTLRLSVLGAVGAALAAVVIAVGGQEPEVADTLAFAGRPASTQVRPDPRVPQLLRDGVDGVRFPDFEAKFDWRATGTRTDALDGRATRTVAYERAGRRVAYTIVGGAALAEPAGAGTASLDGLVVRVVEETPARTVVTWRRDGRTCVMSGAGVPLATLLELAAWKGKGAVRA